MKKVVFGLILLVLTHSGCMLADKELQIHVPAHKGGLLIKVAYEDQQITIPINGTVKSFTSSYSIREKNSNGEVLSKAIYIMVGDDVVFTIDPKDEVGRVICMDLEECLKIKQKQPVYDSKITSHFDGFSVARVYYEGDIWAGMVSCSEGSQS